MKQVTQYLYGNEANRPPKARPGTVYFSEDTGLMFIYGATGTPTERGDQNTNLNIIDNLTTGGVGVSLSAEQGVVLKNLFDSININSKLEDSDINTLSKINSILTDATLLDKSQTNLSGLGFVIDEDNMSSNSDSKLPTQQSVKAYVDSIIAGLTALESEDIDTFVEINTILGDATLIRAEDADTSSFQFVVDEDDFSSNSSSKVPTQQSVKAYVDNISLYKGLIPSGNYDFTVFPPSVTGNVYIDSAPTDIKAGTQFIAEGDGSFTLDPSANPFLVYEFTKGDLITVIEDAANWSVTKLNINENNKVKEVNSFTANVNIIPLSSDVARKFITVSNSSQNGFGISTYKFHLSDDPNTVGTLQGTVIQLEQGIAKDFYLVGPSTAGLPNDGDIENNGTVFGVHFTATWNGGTDITYTEIEVVRHHPGPGDYETRTYNSVVANQTVALNFLEKNYELLFDGISFTAIQSDNLRISKLECYSIYAEEFIAGSTNNGGGGIGQNFLEVTTFTVPEDGNYDLVHTVSSNNSGSNAFTISTGQPTAPNTATGIIYSSAGDRVTSANPSKTYTTALISGTTYYLSVWSGGGSNADEHTVFVSSSLGEIKVFTNEDGTKYAFDSLNNEIDIIGGIPTTWLPCSDDQGTVVSATEALITTNGVNIAIGDKYILFSDGTTYTHQEINDPCAINEYIHNIKDFHLAIAHEGDGGTSMNITFNGVPVTYNNLLNATDSGTGQVNFSSGTNGNFNRRATTVQSLRKVGDYFEITKPATPQFDSEWIEITTTPETSQPEVFSNLYRLQFTDSEFNLRDKDNQLVNSSTPENGIYRITRTLSGIETQKNGVVVYESPVVCNDYSSTFISKTLHFGRMSNNGSTTSALDITTSPVARTFVDYVGEGITADPATATYTIVNDGAYDFSYFQSYEDRNDDLAFELWIDGSSVERLVMQVQSGGLNFQGDFARVNLTSGQTAQIRVLSINGTAENIGDQNRNGIVEYFDVRQSPSSTIINANDILVNDQSVSGYMDIGNMRMQWGIANGGSDTLITLPAPFANTDYSITANAKNTNQSINITIDAGITTTSFVADRRVSTTSTIAIGDFSWQAIGLKP